MSTAAVENPNAVAEGLIGRDYLSYSAVSTFQRCPLQFYFRYVEGISEHTVSSALVFGGAIHAAAEFHFNEVLAGSPPPGLDTLLDVFQESWRDRDAESIRFGKDENVDTLGQLAERMLAAFQASDLAEPAGTIIGVEEELRGELADDCPDLLARVDLLVDDGESLVVTDLKTARSRWSRDKVDESADQLLLYSDLVRELIPGRTVRLKFAVITKAKETALDTHEVTFDANRVARTKRIVRRVWRAIQAGIFYPSPSPMSCPGCPFKRECRAWPG